MKRLFFKTFKIKSAKLISLVLISIFFLIFYKPQYILEISNIDRNIKKLGFEVKKIEVVGNNKVSRNNILNSIKFLDCENIFCLDLKNSKNILEENSWIKSVKLKLNLPSSLLIDIEEETPKFILKKDKSFILLNKEGEEIVKLKNIDKDFENLIVLTGSGVKDRISDLLNIFEKNIDISKSIKEAELVSHRRWSLKHSSNIIIDLPELNPDKAFLKVGKLQNKYGFLSNKIKKVDLRIDNRMIIKLKEKIIEESNI